MSPVSPPAPPSSPPVEDPRRAAIVRVARRWFLTGGYAATRIEPIAREASVSTATLYGYFPSKADLFTAVIQDATEDFARHMERVLTISGSAKTRLRSFALAYAEFMADAGIRAVFRLVIAERPRFRDVAQRFFDKGRAEFGGLLIATLSELQAAGELRMDKPSWAAGQLMGMIENPVFLMPLVTGDEVQAARPARQIADDAVETFLARYGARSPGIVQG